METHEFQVTIPEDHRLMVEVPETVRSGPARLILVVQAEDEERTAEIDRVYTQIGELMAEAQFGGGNGLDEQIRERFRLLRQLQKEEADTLEARFQKRRRLQPGEGLLPAPTHGASISSRTVIGWPRSQGTETPSTRREPTISMIPESCV